LDEGEFSGEDNEKKEEKLASYGLSKKERHI
jgi:hypothetical protein